MGFLLPFSLFVPLCPSTCKKEKKKKRHNKKLRVGETGRAKCKMIDGFDGRTAQENIFTGKKKSPCTGLRNQQKWHWFALCRKTRQLRTWIYIRIEQHYCHSVWLLSHKSQKPLPAGATVAVGPSRIRRQDRNMGKRPGLPEELPSTHITGKVPTEEANLRCSREEGMAWLNSSPHFKRSLHVET